LKTRFVRQPQFDANLKQYPFHKIRTIKSCIDLRRARVPQDHVCPENLDNAASHVPSRHTFAVNAPFTIQPLIHHSTDDSPFRTNERGATRELRRQARENTAAEHALAFV
jgi:hypothetical protein